MKPGSWWRPARRWLIRASRKPRIGRVEFGDFARPTPISRDWGFDRGTPIDRLYIERFLASCEKDIRGRVLEIGGNDYTSRFGDKRVTLSDVLHPVQGNPRATLVADLRQPDASLESRYDCIICTQTLQFIYEVHSTVPQLHGWLRPGGVLLASVPGISQISREDMQRTGDYWRFTDAAVTKMFATEFGIDQIEVEAHGNVLAAISFLHGIAAEEIDERVLLAGDAQFQVLVTLRAVKGN